MPQPALLDHILVTLDLLVVPFVGVFLYRRLVRRNRAGETNARARLYTQGMLINWTLTIGLVAYWFAVDRPAALLGLVAPEGPPLLIGGTITLLGIAFLYTQWKAMLRLDATGLAQVRAQMAEFADLLPRTERKGALFRGVSITAGVCEEIGARGFLIWYLAAFVGPWPAVFLRALIFGLAHLYQGRSGVIKTGVSGLVMGILYVGTGSLLFPIILHAAMDLHGGAMAGHVLGTVPSAEPP